MLDLFERDVSSYKCIKRYQVEGMKFFNVLLQAWTSKVKTKQHSYRFPLRIVIVVWKTNLNLLQVMNVSQSFRI